MVKLHIKRGDESTFLYETTTEILVEDLITQLVKIFNGILKVQRLCQGLFAMCTIILSILVDMQEVQTCIE